MNGVINIVRFITFTVAGLAIRKTWSWLVSDIKPSPGSKEFEQEFNQVKVKYVEMKKRKEEHDKTIRKIR